MRDNRILVAVFLLGFLGFGIYSCQENQKNVMVSYKNLTNHLLREHKLRKTFDYSEMIKTKDSNWSAGGGFFLLFGGFSAGGSSHEDLSTFKNLSTFK